MSCFALSPGGMRVRRSGQGDKTSVGEGPIAWEAIGCQNWVPRNCSLTVLGPIDSALGSSLAMSCQNRVARSFLIALLLGNQIGEWLIAPQ